MIKLQENSIFIADAHYNNERIILKTLLNDILLVKKDIKQIFLMGDIFDFLSYEITYFKNLNKDIIHLINTLALDREIIYLEGNHDFNLEELFYNMIVIPIEKQPLYIKNNNKIIALSHGDIFMNSYYNLYTIIIRNSYFLKFINLLDVNNIISKKIENLLKKKSICDKQQEFDIFIENRIKKYHNCDMIIEGHFHQGYISDKYINIKSLYCSNSYLIYKNNKFKFLE